MKCWRATSRCRLWTSSRTAVCVSLRLRKCGRDRCAERDANLWEGGEGGGNGGGRKGIFGGITTALEKCVVSLLFIFLAWVVIFRFPRSSTKNTQSYLTWTKTDIITQSPHRVTFPSTGCRSPERT
ncbi:hypothetical protein SCHPADRAFT_470962 [Schizopora paradoxa]|uniref:Uncharacterized protein n=1 Tax=Schizopora paradoxa TaxID=27342 RepID=A0A0H2RIN3_9AGAM|nr:hypothetical protein SCHPADRAFT_470962 [Schizopora paradoxa]